MNPHRVADRLGRDSDACRRYREAALARLDGDAGDLDLRRAMAEWRALVPAGRETATDDGTAPADPDRRDAFATALYHDYVLCRLLARVETDLGVRLANPEPGANTGALSVSLGDCHDRIAADAGLPVPGSAVGAGELPATSELQVGGVALLRAIAQSVTARTDRQALGAFYTPRGVADLALDSLNADFGTDSFLDPACGAGVFLVACIERKIRALEAREPDRTDAADADPDGTGAPDADPDAVVEAVTNSVVGLDLDPVAVRAARLASLLALASLLESADRETVAVPVFLTDALGLTRDDAIRFRGERIDLAADALVGNPPWLTWSDLPDAARRDWRDRFSHLDLAPASGVRARLGHANDDLAVPFLLVCVDRYLESGGAIGVVLKRGLTKGPAGRAFRRLRVGDRPLSLDRVHDLASLDPFDAGADAAVYVLSADVEPEFPVPTTVWRTRDGATGPPDFGSHSALRDSLARSGTGLAPVDPTDPASAWVGADAERAALGECDHVIRHGVKDDAAAVFGLDRDELADLEPALVYPYLKSRHVRRWGVDGHDLRLVPQRKAGQDNEADLRERLPGTYAYLDSHRERLESRSSSWLDAGPFYSVFGLGPYTWAPFKVVWCRLGFSPAFAVVSTASDPDLGEKAVVPGDHCMFVACEHEREAHLLCALLNSAPYRRTLRDLAGGGKAGLTKSVVSRLRLPAWTGTDRDERLAGLSMAAHEAVRGATGDADPAGLAAIEGEIDRLVEAILAE